jgi:spore germination protein KA
VLKRFAKLLLKKPKQQNEQPAQHSDELIQLKQGPVFNNLEKNKEAISKIYKLPDNRDLSTRNLIIGGQSLEGWVVFFAPLVNAQRIEQNIIKPLLTNTDHHKQIDQIIVSQSLKEITTFKKVLFELNKGATVLFVEDRATAYSMDTVEVRGRNIEKTQNENILKGPKEAFTENVLDNIALVRKNFRTESLVTESLVVAQRMEDEVFILYLEDVVNQKLLENVKHRLSALHVDSIQNLGLLEQYLEEREKSIFPTILYTERPDRATSSIQDGFIVLLMQGSPACLVLPATFWAFIQSPEERYLRFLFGNYTRVLRMAAIFIALFTSAIYVAITNYHAQMIPADLLLAISSTRERVPFPAVVEVIIMEVAFELIREAGLRVPSPIGPTIGIVGALILGQAAVEANIISPIVIIVVALGGVSSFSVSDISFNFVIRICKFLFIFAAGIFGIYGMTIVFVLGLIHLISIKSFGVPYFAPMTPKYRSSNDTVVRGLLRNERFRPGFLKPKDMQKKGD